MGPPHAVERYDEERKAVDACVTALNYDGALIVSNVRDPELRRKFSDMKDLERCILGYQSTCKQYSVAIRTMRACGHSSHTKVGIEPLAWQGNQCELTVTSG